MKGIDTSHHNVIEDWNSIVQAKYLFCIQK